MTIPNLRSQQTRLQRIRIHQKATKGQNRERSTPPARTPNMDDEPVELFHVGVRKYGLDESSPWWRKLFFRAIFLPFNRFAFKRMKIPAMDKLEPDNSFSWFEHIGVFTERELADSACKGEFWQVTPLLVNASLPTESCQRSCHTFPKSAYPDRHNRRVFPLVVEPLGSIDAMGRAVTQLEQVLDK